MGKSHSITGGIYLVLDPGMEQELLLNKLSAALAAGINVVQIWNNWSAGIDKLKWVEAVAGLCNTYHVPLFINEEWQLLTQCQGLQGVHFDTIPTNYKEIQQTVGRPFLSGITCSGNLKTVEWAYQHGFDYVSFCAMFPSPSAGSCDIVMPQTVKQARGMTNMPIFVSGGVTPENIALLKKETPFDGVAVISGILSAGHPQQKVKEYQQALAAV
ncbi:thiamine phosphate synthase [Mucilaginibacter galii]|nr:thiamine phosphate synthase [Mucilaginibacter galii]